MEKSLFSEFLGKTYGPLLQRYYEKLNGKQETPTYLHKSLFREEYSADGRWGSLSGYGTTTTADIVALDSSLPLKKRDSIGKVEGRIPKLGMKMTLNENQMVEIELLKARGQYDRIQRILYNDSFKCVEGVEEMLEYLSLQAASTGTILVDDADKPGNGIRVDFGIPGDNQLGVSYEWSHSSATPIADIERMIDNAKELGYTLRYIHMGKAKSKEFLNHASVKDFYAGYNQFTGTNILKPSLEKINDALQGEFGVQINVIDRSVRFERDGKKVVKQCWAENMVVGSVDLDFGTLTYTDLAEETYSASQVAYNKAGSYTLVSKYHDVDPLREFTSSQARVIPILQDVDSLFYLDTTDTETITVGQTEGNTTIDIDGSTTVTRAAFITALNNVGVSKANESNKDATLVKYYNDLDAATQAEVDTELGI